MNLYSIPSIAFLPSSLNQLAMNDCRQLTKVIMCFDVTLQRRGSAEASLTALLKFCSLRGKDSSGVKLQLRTL